MIRAFLLLGSNDGDRLVILGNARKAIEASAGKLVSTSSIYETAAWGNNDQAPFLNQAIAIDTPMEALQLLDKLQKIELALGRVRKQRWGPRTIDIDILLYGDLTMSTPILTIPHPGVPDRRFTLVPMAEIAGNLYHPVLRKTMQELLIECKDALAVEIFQEK